MTNDSLHRTEIFTVQAQGNLDILTWLEHKKNLKNTYIYIFIDTD